MAQWGNSLQRYVTITRRWLLKAQRNMSTFCKSMTISLVMIVFRMACKNFVLADESTKDEVEAGKKTNLQGRLITSKPTTIKSLYRCFCSWKQALKFSNVTENTHLPTVCLLRIAIMVQSARKTYQIEDRNSLNALKDGLNSLCSSETLKEDQMMQKMLQKRIV